ncbi:MAG: transposase, partial [Verrucomicrobiota bacterium]
MQSGRERVATIIVAKFCYHQTLYRLEERYWQMGQVWVSRSTMCGWLAGCAEALEFLCREMKVRVLESGYIGMDDTSVKMLVPGEGKTRTTRMWSYVGMREEAPYNLYDFRLTREKTGPLEYLGDYRGYPQGDAYSGHDAMMKREGVTEVGCWDHARRYVTDASDEDARGSSEVLALIRRLYQS